MAQSKADKKDLTKGPVWQNLFNLSAPMILGITAVLSISLVDTYFVSQLGTAELAALSFTFPVALTIASIAIGLGAGASSVVSRAIGAKRANRAKRLSTDSLMLGFIVVLILSTIGFFTIRPLFGMMGAEGDVLDLIERYMRIWYLSMPFLVVPMIASALIRAAGDAYWPSVIMMTSAALNIALTPAMIYGWWIFPEMHIEGAAIATMCARMFIFVFAGPIVVFREKMVVNPFDDLAEIVSSWQEVLKISIPAAVGNATYPIVTGVVTAILSQYGEAVVAAYGSATRIEAFAIIPLLAISSAIGPIAGQNWGAGIKDRVKEAQIQSYGFSAIWSLILFAVMYFAGPTLASVFSSDAEVMAHIDRYLKIVSISFFGYGISVIAAGCFNGIGRPFTALTYYAIRSVGLILPLCYAASYFVDTVPAVFIAIACANVISGLSIAWHALRQCY